jgi:hypothetical protein
LDAGTPIEGGHLGDLQKYQTGVCRQLFQSLDIAHAPFRIALAKARVEHGVADGGMFAVALERSIEEQSPVRPQGAAGARE